MDSAAMIHLSTDLTAQAHVLATHQQLSHLTHLTEELVKAPQLLNSTPNQPANPIPLVPLSGYPSNLVILLLLLTLA